MVVGPLALPPALVPSTPCTDHPHSGASFATIGESGLGKSTLINTLFNTSLYAKKNVPAPHHERPKTVAIESITAGTVALLALYDLWKPILDNIEARFDAYLEQENRVNRQKMVDNRIHACLYFIEPTGHSCAFSPCSRVHPIDPPLSPLRRLKPVDIEFMRRLHTKVNLIPIIAKADTMTDDEVLQFKARILSDIAHHHIDIYQAPQYEQEDEETLAENEEIIVGVLRASLFDSSQPDPPLLLPQRKIPFAVVGSDAVVATPDGRQVRGRAYPWGTIEVDNEDHCDFVKLRQMLIRTHMEELKEHTNNTLYENYRSEKLLGMGVTQDHSVFKEVNPAAKMAEERALHESKLAKMEAEMKMVFQQKVNEKEAKLKQSEEELYARHREMKEALEKQRLELDEKKRRLESGRPLTPEKASQTTKKKGFLRT
ncbi:SPOSA6832_00698, partial [Sporobolomyces salmonicolor]